MSKKDSYWFNHDADAGEDIKMLKILRIYDFWGWGLYWRLIEILRKQPGYMWSYNETDIGFLCEHIRCKDESRFKTFLNDAIRIELFKVENNNFFSSSLIERMTSWEHKKIAGKKGGQAKRKQTPKQNSSKTEADPQAKLKQNGSNIHTYKQINTIKDVDCFNLFRLLYPGTKLGNETEFDNFCSKHKDWNEILPILFETLKNQIEHKKTKASRGEFVPEWKNLKTWINQRCWEEVIPETTKKNEEEEIKHSDFYGPQ